MCEPGGARAATIAALHRLAAKRPLGIAVSGGGDSLALLAMAAEARTGLHAVTVDHGLRPEAWAEAKAVADFAAARGIPHTTLTARIAPGGNLSARARTARYDLIATWARQHGLDQVALGHTLDDQAETVLLRLARGAGADGLAAMAESRDWLGIRWLRPMLAVGRADLRTWLTDRSIPWAEDPTNQDPHYDRVRARQALGALAPLGIDAAALAATAGRLQAQKAVLQAETAALAAETRTWGPFSEAWIDPNAAKALPEVARRLIVDTLMQVAGLDYAPRQRSLDALLPGLWAADFPGATLAGCLIQRMKGQILICREPAAVAATAPLPPTGLLWDRRWWIDGAPRKIRIGALGAEGIAEIKRAEAAGWAAPAPWQAASHAVKLTLPALWNDPGGAPPHLVAVPPIAYLSPNAPSGAGDVTATPALRHDDPGPG
ncbi:MAG: tRNA lysidine(34) synthetase TilS [Pseudomonadota bacterium]